ncbi:unnamed protein product [Caenorhabditis sp. 36 PRJEB53466]|nr:unnamed protein product [Caenorhabditis sp. 36 PRJEB53466]
MVLRIVCTLSALLITFAAASVDCTREDACFGEPAGCDPKINCRTLFHFDAFGNLDLFLRNFVDPLGYAAFAIDQHADETIEYFLCVPYQNLRVRALATLGEAIIVINQNLTGIIEKVGPYHFRCHFNAVEFSEHFHVEQHFFVSKGRFDEALVIFDGDQLFSLDWQTSVDDESYESDLDLEEDDLLREEEMQSPVESETWNDKKHHFSESNKALEMNVLTEEKESRPSRYREHHENKKNRIVPQFSNQTESDFEENLKDFDNVMVPLEPHIDTLEQDEKDYEEAIMRMIEARGKKKIRVDTEYDDYEE